MVRKIAILLALIALPLLLATCTTMVPPEHLFVQPATQETSYAKDTLKVMSLNLAHGRKDGINQLLLGESRIRKNLQDIAATLRQVDADIVALQEADGASRWSGSFDHVEEISRQAEYPAYLRTSHAVSLLFSYGTALLSKAPFADVLYHTFQPSPPTMNKGFTLGRIFWLPNAEAKEVLPVDVISVHLDFSRKTIRERQIEEMSEVLAGRDNLKIILGDFNSDWFADEKVVRALAESSGLHVYRPEAQDLGTYNSSGRRLDWILISDELEFTDYEILPDTLSDHLVVVATIALKQP